MTDLEAPWWLVSPVDEWPRLAWSGEAAPVILEPPGTPDPTSWDGTVTDIRTNLQNNYDTLVKTPAEVAGGIASDAWHTFSGWFADPSGTGDAGPAPLGPSETADVPTPDPPVVYTGPGTVPTWEDVFNWYATTTHAQTPDVPVPTPIAGVQVQHAIDVANGQTIKALSGFINNAVNLNILSADVLAGRIADTQTVISALNANQALTNQQLHAILDLIANGALPQLWDAVNQLHDQIIGTGAAILKNAQVWATDNIHTPLSDAIGQERTDRIAQVDGVEQGLAGRVVGIVEGLGLATAADVAGLAARVANLEQENTDCTEPMCETMGPNTNLGKLLKALSLASEAAFIAELLAMNESDLAAFLQTAAHKVATVVDDFQTTFQPGAETIGGFIKNTIEAAT